MAILSITGTQAQEVARLTASALGFRLVLAPAIRAAVTAEFGSVPEPSWHPAAQTILCRWCRNEHLVLAFDGCESYFPSAPQVLRILIAQKPDSKHDLQINPQSFTAAQAAELIQTAVRSKWKDHKPTATFGSIEFTALKQLASRGIVPKTVTASAHEFSHPSEEFFASVLQFYGIRWQYEPRSFPLQWSKDGEVREAFTPDFYLPAEDLYIELTTMKQALVTRKNRKVKLLKAIYPHVKIEILYQRDLQDLLHRFNNNLASTASPDRHS